MNISILSVFPELYQSFLTTSLVQRSQQQGLVHFDLTSFFAYVQPKERIDAPTFGHGAGMLIKPEVVQNAIQDKEQKHGKAFKIFFSPHGKKLDQNLLKKLASQAIQANHLMLVAGRYEGMDSRVEEQYADEIVSIGDYVLMGGDVPAMVLLEGLLRLMPGVVGKQESIEQESFSGPFVDYPEYTEPVEWEGKRVPDVVRSGNHGALRQWRTQQAAHRTVKGHFEWLRKQPLTPEQKLLVHQAIPPHYVLLNHADVFVGRESKIPGYTSITSLDIHDIARSCKTYGIKEYCLVSPLEDQQKIAKTLLNFWHTGVGVDYNRQRHEAVKHVSIMSTVDEVIAHIESVEGVRPLLVATSARQVEHHKHITFYDQGMLWSLQRPLLFVFGTGQGLTPDFIARCDYILPPVGGLTEFKHLSVRSAVAVILDRWLGLSPE
ncbi:MAG TPA: tRNA (guanosine(37)-N1)-methyltransferase TrmD [Candidatus Limnocylindria bacterium]|nr:tRNA (guanosine(37)-N1)-methyltransferase TrmD [Candidatus Limnocylindria bacterium]